MILKNGKVYYQQLQEVLSVFVEQSEQANYPQSADIQRYLVSANKINKQQRFKGILPLSTIGK